MTILNNNYQETINKLKSGNSLIIESTLSDIDQSGVIELVPTLIDTLAASFSSSINSKIISILSNIKISKANEIFISTLKNTEYLAIKRDIIAICWQSGLDFTNNFDVFLASYINDDFDIAIEAYTLLNELIPHLSKENQLLIIKTLGNEYSRLEPLKQELVRDLIFSENN